MAERILCAAVWIDDGQKYAHQPMPTGLVFAGWRHAQCIVTATTAFPDRRVRQEDQGFLTSMGRFVGRVEALRIARARGQIRKAGYIARGDELYSEDLY
jgi:hypothetical protein